MDEAVKEITKSTDTMTGEVEEVRVEGGKDITVVLVTVGFSFTCAVERAGY